jgi:hypothetical protein
MAWFLLTVEHSDSPRRHEDKSKTLEIFSKVTTFSHTWEPPVLGRTNPSSSETRIIGLADGGPIKKGGTGVTPSSSARGRAAPGLDITPILKSGKGIAALQNGANRMGTFESGSLFCA